MFPIKELSALVRGKRVLVIGSAPLDTALAFGSETVVVACNGGIGHVPADVPVHVWSVNARESIIESRVETNRAMMRQGAGRSIPFAILHTRGGELGVAAFMRVMETQKTRIDGYVSLEADERRVQADMAGAYAGSLMRNQVISNGILTVAMCCAHGAANVEMHGFSWKAGYHYPTKTEIKARGHVAADKGGLSNLVRRYPGVILTALDVSKVVTGALMAVVEPNQVERVIVRAKFAGLYGGHRRRVGDEFEINHRSHLRQSWMELVEVQQKPMADGENVAYKDKGPVPVEDFNG